MVFTLDLLRILGEAVVTSVLAEIVRLILFAGGLLRMRIIFIARTPRRGHW